MNFPHKDPISAKFTMPQIAIKTMSDVDVGRYCVLFQSVFSKTPWNEIWTIAKIKTDIKKVMRKKGFWGMVAKADTEDVGYLTGFRLKLFPSVFYIDQLFVDVNYHGKKIGKRLLLETSNHLKRFGVSKLFLLTKPDSVAEKFYRNNEFKRFLPPMCIRGKGVFFKNI